MSTLPLALGTDDELEMRLANIAAFYTARGCLTDSDVAAALKRQLIDRVEESLISAAAVAGYRMISCFPSLVEHHANRLGVQFSAAEVGAAHELQSRIVNVGGGLINQVERVLGAVDPATVAHNPKARAGWLRDMNAAATILSKIAGACGLSSLRKDTLEANVATADKSFQGQKLQLEERRTAAAVAAAEQRRKVLSIQQSVNAAVLANKLDVIEADKVKLDATARALSGESVEAALGRGVHSVFGDDGAEVLKILLDSAKSGGSIP